MPSLPKGQTNLISNIVTWARRAGWIQAGGGEGTPRPVGGRKGGGHIHFCGEQAGGRKPLIQNKKRETRIRRWGLSFWEKSGGAR